MAKIIYRKGMEGQNKLSCIEGIEIGLLNGQKALIFPKYSKEYLMQSDQIDKWNGCALSEIEALKVEDTVSDTVALFNLGSPAANWVLLFVTEDRRQFSLPSLLAAMEIQHQEEEIDALAETIEGADLLRDFTSGVWSCSRTSLNGVWLVIGGYVYAGSSGVNGGSLGSACLAVPTILYRGGGDMKTIKERAKEYAPDPFDPDYILPAREGHIVNQQRSAYIAGAKEQKALDIDKACEWLEENARDYACATIRCPYGEEEEIICDIHQEIVEDFRKAMEEEK